MTETAIASDMVEPAGWKRQFFTIWSGQAVSLFGSSLVGFALVWWITDTTKSATLLATASLVSMLPQILLGPFVGALVDRWNRKQVMMVADSAVALVSLALAGLFLSGRVQIWHIYVVMVIRSLGGAFHFPAMQASTSLMVPDSWLARVSGMNQALFGAMNIIAPPLGALLLGLVPVGGILLIDVFTAMAAVFSVWLVAVPQPARNGALSQAVGLVAVWQDLKVGLRYVASWPGFILLGSFATLINFLLNPAFSLLPIMVTRHFGGGALELGVINSAWGIGVVVGGVGLGAWGGFKRRIHTSLFGLACMGAGILVLAGAPASAFWLGVAGMALAGLMNPICNGPLFAILQATVAPEMQGRVFSLMGSVAGAASPLGLAIAGPVSDALGVQVWFVLGGVSCILMALSALFVPVMMNLEEQGKALRQGQLQA
jgi:DHA3 family macrolide efflux protein-like MFS transporter